MKTKLALSFLLMITLSSCAVFESSNSADTFQPVTGVPTKFTMPATSLPVSAGEIDFISNGAIQFLEIYVDLINAPHIDLPLVDKPVWIAGIPFENGSAWAVAFENGNLQAFLVNSQGYTALPIFPEKLAPEIPLTIYSRNGQLFALTAPVPESSPFSPLIVFGPDFQKTGYIAKNNDLVILQNDRETRLPVNALPDSRILVDENDRLLLLTHPTDRYGHAVLGDEIEASGITLIETIPEPRVLQTISIPEPDVIEGIAPIWADMNNDGEYEIIVTLSNAQEGARIVIFREDGSLLAEGPSIGNGFRWRHQLIAAPFGESGENLLAVVRTPHIGGVLEFYRLNGNKLEIVQEVSGISTHIIGSRNLFTAQAGDFDNDGRFDLLAPDQSHTRLGIFGMGNNPIAWIDLGAELVTNLAAVTLLDSDKVVLAAGLSSNFLRVWRP